MQWLESVILGLIQGLTEFLPVSSSGHLVMFQELLGYKPDGGIVFEVAVHVATLVAIVLFYRKRVGALTIGTLRMEADALRYVGKLVVGTLPAIAVALLAREFIEAQFAAPAVAGFMLLITGFIVWSTRYTIAKGTETEPSWKNALLIGCAQAFAIMPGISRSGTTVATAMALGMTPLAAAEFSFLLGVIAIAGAAVLLLPEMMQADAALIGSIMWGSIAALISGLAALVTFVWFLKKQKFFAFAWYAWAAGAAFLVWLQLAR